MQSYDHVDHAEIVAAYDKFLDRWGFRKAFPATEQLWLSLGKKCYDTWQNYMENARISSELDFCAISGWESTAIENHSGIVDNLRNFKSDPKPIAETLLPVRPVAKQRVDVYGAGQERGVRSLSLQRHLQGSGGERWSLRLLHRAGSC